VTSQTCADIGKWIGNGIVRLGSVYDRFGKVRSSQVRIGVGKVYASLRLGSG
jgi:hypothetical protein